MTAALTAAAASFAGGSYDSLVTACANLKALGAGRAVHGHMAKSLLRPSVYLATRLLIMYDMCGDLLAARAVLDEMPERSIASWTAMISGYSRRKLAPDALHLFAQMLRTGTTPNEFTFATILASCSVPGRSIVHGLQIHSWVVKTNFQSHVFVGSSLLDMYAKSGNLRDAREVFDMVPQRDVVSCTAMISGYAQSGLDEEALEMFRKLYGEGMECNYVTFSSLLTALSGLAALDSGKQVHGLVIRRRLLPSYVVLQNSLIDMYSKCGDLCYARKVFDEMPQRSVISWNAMIVAYGKHGLGREAVRLFGSMMPGAVRPDGATYTAVLSGCSHGGLIDEGLRIFDRLVDDRNVEISLEHYACVVDILGRAGRIEKALDFMKSMPFEPTPAMWGSLLGACRLHSNVHMGELVAGELLCSEPQNAGNYVILSNIYAKAGRWQDVSRVRGIMQEKTVMKEPGMSRICIDRTVHTFNSGDRLHPFRVEIRAKVGELCMKIKEAGYVPDLSCVLHDVDDEQKEKILLGHSEKLAIAFGMMQTSGDVRIQIVKNLRICVDCHNFAKFVSRVFGRELSLRDKNRFHLVEGGVCSCLDYW